MLYSNFFRVLLRVELFATSNQAQSIINKLLNYEKNK